ncbi:MAG: alanine dehydrogenase [Synergistaceae bacterium]|jgi:alanine dehydrogenase|nr:alanine dehydrogenase [Synergistaceae bacterium]
MKSLKKIISQEGFVMRVGCPKEIKNGEYRVGITPAAASSYVKAGHEVCVERDAGLEAGFSDEEYSAVGAVVAQSPDEIWAKCDMIVKVKEPLPPEYPLIRENQILFTYFHFAANRELTETCLRSKSICVACELVEEPWGLPLLQPMSEVAGRMSVLMGSYYLARNVGGSGVLSTGVPGVAPAKILIVGGGIVGANAARIAAGLAAIVVVTDVSHKRLEYLSEILPFNCISVYSDSHTITKEIIDADMLIGAVLLRGGAATPKLITREHLRSMRPGSVFVDVSIDQGGIAQTSRPTTHDNPVFVEEGVVHYCVSNMPGAYSRTSTISLSNATIDYGLQLANLGVFDACRQNEALSKGLATCRGKLTVAAVADAFGLHKAYADPEAVIHKR